MNARDYGAVGDGIADDTAAISAALRAAGGGSVVLPAGTYLIPSATRLQMFASYSSLVGDPSGSSVLRFTHPSGGIDVGNGTDFIYQNLIQNLVIDGFNIAQTPLRLRKSEEMGMVNVRVHQAVVAAIETTDTSLFHSTRLQLARAPIGIKTLGYLGTAGLHDGNFYLLDSIVSVEGTGVAHLVVSGVTYIELVKAGVRFNRMGGPISIGTIHFRDCYVTSSLADFSLFKGVAATGINAGALLATDLNAYLPNVTTPPFVDFRGLTTPVRRCEHGSPGETSRLRHSDPENSWPSTNRRTGSSFSLP
ncbi:glycosyl hydrolase family 28-related protein [Arthrobacter sp. alpha11c]